MIGSDTNKSGYILATVLGAVSGGLIVALATNAIPKMMSQMMRNMMSQMRESGCDPIDI